MFNNEELGNFEPSDKIYMAIKGLDCLAYLLAELPKNLSFNSEELSYLLTTLNFVLKENSNILQLSKLDK